MRTKLAFATLVVALLAGCTAYPPSARYGMYHSSYQGVGMNVAGYYGASQPYGYGYGYDGERFYYPQTPRGPKYGTMTYVMPGVTKSRYAICHGPPEVQTSQTYMFMGILLRFNTTDVDHGCDHYTHVHSETPTIIYRKSLP